MKNQLTIIVTLLSVGVSFNSAWADGSQGMPGMPLIQPKKTYSVTSNDQGEELVEQRGFGDQEPEVRMMNLMMVEGSGFEGMDMSDPAAMKAMSEKSYSGDSHGAHAGHGAMAAASEAAAKQTAKSADSSFNFEVSIAPNPPKVGANILTVRPTHVESGKPAKALKAKAEVYMTSMDMGTETPKVKEVKPGEYQIKAIFSMAGPWAVKFITVDGSKIFNFQVTK